MRAGWSERESWLCPARFAQTKAGQAAQTNHEQEWLAGGRRSAAPSSGSSAVVVPRLLALMRIPMPTSSDKRSSTAPLTSPLPCAYHPPRNPATGPEREQEQARTAGRPASVPFPLLSWSRSGHVRRSCSVQHKQSKIQGAHPYRSYGRPAGHGQWARARACRADLPTREATRTTTACRL